MKLKSRIWLIIVAALIGLITVSAIALYTLKQQLVEEKQVQIKTLLEMSVSVAKYYHEQEDTDLAAERMDDVKQQVAHGVDLAVQAADALRQIHASSEQSLTKTREVANSAHEQSQASNSIAVNIEKIAQMVEASDAAVHFVHDQLQNLDALAKELHEAASRFRLH